MSKIIKEIINKSGKKTSVSFENKEKRIAFNEAFGKKKMDIAINFIGGKEKAIALSKHLANDQNKKHR